MENIEHSRAFCRKTSYVIPMEITWDRKADFCPYCGAEVIAFEAWNEDRVEV